MKAAIRERLENKTREDAASREQLVEKLMDIGRRYRAELEANGISPEPDGTDHTAFLYDEFGLPK